MPCQRPLLPFLCKLVDYCFLTLCIALLVQRAFICSSFKPCGVANFSGVGNCNSCMSKLFGADVMSTCANASDGHVRHRAVPPGKTPGSSSVWHAECGSRVKGGPRAACCSLACYPARARQVTLDSLGSDGWNGLEGREAHVRRRAHAAAARGVWAHQPCRAGREQPAAAGAQAADLAQAALGLLLGPAPKVQQARVVLLRQLQLPAGLRAPGWE